MDFFGQPIAMTHGLTEAPLCRWLVPIGGSSSHRGAAVGIREELIHKPLTQLLSHIPHPNSDPSTAAIRWWMRAVNYCQLWPGRGPNISACRPSTCEGWSVLQNPGGWVDQNVPLPRKWELAKSGSYMTAAMLGMLGVTIYIYIYRKMAISWTINRDLIRSYVDATIYKSKIRWLYLLVIC